MHIHLHTQEGRHCAFIKHELQSCSQSYIGHRLRHRKAPVDCVCPCAQFLIGHIDKLPNKLWLAILEFHDGQFDDTYIICTRIVLDVRLLNAKVGIHAGISGCASQVFVFSVWNVLL